MKKLWQNNYFKVIILSLIISLFIIGPGIIYGRGVLIIGDDFNHQQIPFNMVMNDFIKSGNVLWNHINDLGADFLGTFSFYNLASPFVLIGFLFPASIFPYLIGPILILKYIVAALLSFIFLKRYVKDQKYAVIGSLLYSFCGFQITNMLFNHFHDVVAFFPLLLIALDKIFYDNKKGWLIFAVALNALTNYFFFVGQVIFVLIYFLVKIFTKEYQFTFRKFIQIVIESIIGVGLCAILLVPSLLFVINNPRVGGDWNFLNALFYSLGRYADILKAFIFSPDLMQARSMVVEYNYRSVELFLPLIGCIVFCSYLYKYPKKWGSILSFILIIMMLIPILNSLFVAFADYYYARWFYMPILIFVLLSIQGLEEKISIKPGLIMTIAAFIILAIGGLIFKLLGEKLIYEFFYFIIIMILFAASLIYFILIYRLKDKNKFQKYLLIGIICYLIIIGNVFIYQCKKKFEEKYYPVDYYLNYVLNVKDYIDINLNDYERIDASSSCSYNLGLLLNQPVLKGFNSNISGNAFKFYYSTKFYRRVETNLYNEDYPLRNFLGIKYIISCSEEDNKYFDGNYKFITKNEPYYIYENENYQPLGILYDYYISEENYFAEYSTERKNILPYALVLNDEQINKYQHLIKELPSEVIPNILQTNLEIRKDSSFKINKNIITDHITLEKEQLFLYTIPYDNGWKLKINGLEEEVEIADNGFMLLKLNKGVNNIELTYDPLSHKIGIIISGLSLIGAILYIIYYKVKE